MNPSLVTEYKDLRYLISTWAYRCYAKYGSHISLEHNFFDSCCNFFFVNDMKNESNKWGYQVLTFETLSKT